MNSPLRRSAKKGKAVAASDKRATQQRLRAIEGILLEEFDDARRELDRAKVDPDLDPDIKATCEQYLSVIQRMRGFLGDGVVPAGVHAKLASISDGKRSKSL